MEAMPTRNLEMAPFVHVLVHHILQCVCRTGVPLGPTSEQALESQHTLFDIFFPQVQTGLYRIPNLPIGILNTAALLNWCHF